MRRLGHAPPAAANRYLHTIDGRDAEIASALSALAAHGDAARLPESIVVKHRWGARGVHAVRCWWLWPGEIPIPDKRKVGGSTPPLTTGFAM